MSICHFTLSLKHTFQLDNLKAQTESIAMQVHLLSCLYFVCQSGEEYKRQGHPTSLQFCTVFQSNQYCPTWLNQRHLIPQSPDNWKLLAWRTGQEYQFAQLLAFCGMRLIHFVLKAIVHVLEALGESGTSSFSTLVSHRF